MDAKTAVIIIVLATVLTEAGILVTYKRWCDKLL